MSFEVDCYVMSYIILDSVCEKWETRCDILVIQGFNHKSLVSPSPNFKGICEGRRCHHWFHIYFIRARRCPLSSHIVCCERGASTIFSNRSVPFIFCKLCAWVPICKIGHRIYTGWVLATPVFSAFIYMILLYKGWRNIVKMCALKL